MSITIRCSSEADIYCPKCGFSNIVARFRPASHCGNCGASVVVELVERPSAQEDQEQFIQISLFEE